MIGAEYSVLPWTIDGPAKLFDDGLRDLYHGDIQALVLEYYRRTRAMVQAGDIDIVGHLDRILFNNIGARWWNDSADWYHATVEETLRVIAAHDTLLELNTSGWYAPLGLPNPSPWILPRCRELGIRVVVNTDAHRPDVVGRGLSRAERLLQASGYHEVWRLRAGRWEAQPI